MEEPMTAPSFEQMQDMFRAHTAAALKVIVEIMNGSGGKGDAVRLSAAKEILSRAWGKPAPQEKKVPEEKKDEAPEASAAKTERDQPAGEASSPAAAATAPKAGTPAPWFRGPKPPAAEGSRRAASGG
jgi:hypothetical protein